MKIRMITLALLLVPFMGHTAEEDEKDLKNIQFESLLIQGQVQRPDITIVTGDAGDDMDGLLRLRQNFNDLMAQDAGEEIR